ncbi:NAD(P)H-binding protein [Actinomyces mediterranea]|uniref:NAD(P)H-binding protein n=1 Tax=Actinomyces mediterranea TaxID=1871028 RepID=UPI0038B27133
MGREVSSQLVASKRSIRALTRNDSRARRLLGPDEDVVVEDIANPNDVAAALHGVDSVILTHGGDSDPQRINCGAVKALVTALSGESGQAGSSRPTPVRCATIITSKNGNNG